MKILIILTLIVFIFGCKESNNLTFKAVVYNTSGYEARVYIGDTLTPIYILMDQDSIVLDGVCDEVSIRGCLVDNRSTPSSSSIVFDTLRILRRDASECLSNVLDKRCISSDPSRPAKGWSSEARNGKQHYLFTISEADFQEAVPL